MSKVLYTTESATKNHERLIETAQKNIVNANDPNYIRQDAKLISDPQVGAKIESVDLIVNEMLLKTQYQKASEHSNLELESSYLQKIIDFFGTPKLYRDDTKEVSLTPNLSGALQAFFNSLNDLQISSNDSASMGNSVNAVKNAAEKTSGLAENLQKLRQEVDGQIAESVNELNQHLDSLRSLSDKLPLLKDNDAAYNDAKAKMINGIREVSEIIDVRYRYDEHGSLVLETGNSAPLIKDGIEYKVKFSRTDNLENYLDRSFEFPALSVGGTADDEPQYRTDIVTSGTPENIVHHLKGGKLQALFNLRDKLIPDIVGSLDQFTVNLTTKANDIYADAVPETGFQSITSTETFKDDDELYINGKFKIAFLDPETGKVITHNGQPLPMLKFAWESKDKILPFHLTFKNLIQEINEKFNNPLYLSYKITAELVDANGNAVQSGKKGYLRLKADNANFNFAIVDEGTNFNASNKGFDESEKSGKLKGINQFFGFSKQLFTYATERFYDARSGANSAISLKVSDNIVNENRLATAKVRTIDDTNYGIGNKDLLKDLLQLKNEKFEFAGTDETPKSVTTLSHFGNNVVLALNSKNSSVSGKLEVSKVELDSISEQIASQSGVNTDEELLNITRYERTYLSTLKVFQTFNEYWRQFLNQVN